MAQNSSPKILKNKPLIEAIFELRWGLEERGPGIKIDPNYRILIGRIYDRLKEEYPYHEQLPTATIPDEIAGYVVQHRFRRGQDMWPLVQIGPGIMTVNDTEGYTWSDFKKRAIQAVDALFEAYPSTQMNLKISSTLLRYIDAINFDFAKNDIFAFLAKHMKIELNLNPKLFDNTTVDKLPLGLDYRVSFRCSRPKGIIHLRFARGKKKDSDALIWETMVQSSSGDAPVNKPEIAKWLEHAHYITDDWFFKLIEGELLRRFE